MVEFITVGRMVVCVLIMDDINTTMPPLDVEIEFVQIDENASCSHDTGAVA